MSSLAEIGLDLEWFDRAVTTLDRAAGTGSAVRATVLEHLADGPVAVLVGPFNSGKSSLLKRLCVDFGAPVPALLQVRADPSTPTSYEVRLNGWRCRDTPGLDAEDADHTRAATTAAELAELTVLVMTHELFSDDSQVAALLRDHGLRGDALIAVVSRADKCGHSGGSPAYRDWAASKTEEALERLESLGVVGAAVFAVAADARGRVANKPATPEQYEFTREWDGVAALADALRQLHCTPQLRRGAVVRTVASAARAGLAALEEKRLASMDAAAKSDASVHELDLALSELAEFETAARLRLRADLVAAAQGGPASSARGRIHVAADDWATTHAAQLEAAASRSQVEVDPWRFDLTAATSARGLDVDDDIEQVADFDLARLEELLESRLDGLDDAERAQALREDLQCYAKARKEHRVREYYADDGGPSSIADVREAQGELKRLQRRQATAEAGRAALTLYREERELRKQQRERAELARARAEMAESMAVLMARALFDGGDVEGWRANIRTVVDELADRRDSEIEAGQRIEGEVHSLDELAGELTALSR